MNFQQLEYIVALDSHRHFVTAANQCCVTQPTLSMQVQKLEEELGILIFDRKKSPMEPTPAGAKVVLQARQILRQLQELRESVKEDRKSMAGEFRIGIIPTLAQYLMPLFLIDFIQKYPQTRLQIEEINTEQIIHKLKHDQLDVGILVTPLQENDIREVPVFNEPFLAYISKDHPLTKHEVVTPADLPAEDLWLLNQGHCFRNQMLNICNVKDNACTTKGFTYESGSIETLKKMVDRHYGYTLVPELSTLDEDPQKVTIKRFAEPEPAREVSIVTHQNFVKEVLLETLRKEMLEKIPERMRINTRTKIVKWR
jgi:LysR family hydrogen peroxide-inducible transcriptional activator